MGMKWPLRAVEGGDGCGGLGSDALTPLSWLWYLFPHEPPLPRRAAVWKASAACVNDRFGMLSIALSEQQLEADLVAGVLACPVCSGRLGPWGYARPREVRMLDGLRWLTPRRGWCYGCGAT